MSDSAAGTGVRLASLALVEHKGERATDRYCRIDATDAKAATFRLDPACHPFTLREAHFAKPPDFQLVMPQAPVPV